jgi:hypothetical protein
VSRSFIPIREGDVVAEGRSKAGFLKYEERGFSIINRNMIGGRYKLVVTACAVLTEGGTYKLSCLFRRDSFSMLSTLILTCALVTDVFACSVRHGTQLEMPTLITRKTPNTLPFGELRWIPITCLLLQSHSVWL